MLLIVAEYSSGLFEVGEVYENSVGQSLLEQLGIGPHVETASQQVRDRLRDR